MMNTYQTLLTQNDKDNEELLNVLKSQKKKDKKTFF